MVPSTPVFVWSLQRCQQKMDGGWLIICPAVINTLRSRALLEGLTFSNDLSRRVWTAVDGAPFQDNQSVPPLPKRKKKVLICFPRVKKASLKALLKYLVVQ